MFMPFKKLLSDYDVIQILSVNLGAIGITLLDVELGLKILCGMAAFGYTMWKWITEYKSSKK